MKVKTCLRFPGGKFYGLKKIHPFLQVEHKEYRESMVGGGSVFLGKKPASEINWINDKDENLINFYKVIQREDQKLELYELLENQIASKQKHAEIKVMKSKNKIEQAFKFFYLNRTSFSGIMVSPRWGYMLGSSVTPDRWKDIIEPVSKKLEHTKITCFDFRKVINAKTKFHDHEVLIYVDPPYYDASKNIYRKSFTKKDHSDLCQTLKKCPYKFVLSYDESEDVREMYDWAKVEDSKWTYYMSEERRQEGCELIISNFKINEKLL